MIVFLPSLILAAFIWFNRVAWVRILVLQQQLAVYKRKVKKPLLKNRDRLFWTLLSRLWRDWASDLIFVKPETVTRWRKRQFREFWRWKSQSGSAGLLCPPQRRFRMPSTCRSAKLLGY
jgi:hypothetical protein